jgi:hypothetical protein
LEQFVNQHAEEDLQEAPREIQNEAGYLLYTLGKNFYLIEDYATAAEYFETGLAFDLNVKEDYVIEMVEAYGFALLNSHQGRSGIVLEAVYDDFCNHADFCFMMGLVYLEQKQYEQAVVEFAKAVSLPEGRVKGSNSFLAFYYAGECRLQQNRLEEAIQFYRQAGTYDKAQEKLEELL